MPRDIVLSNKICGKEGGKGVFGVRAFVFLSSCYTRWSPAFLETADHRPAERKQRINSFARAHSFALPIKLSLS